MDPNLYLDTVSKKLKRVTQEAKDAKKAIIYNLCSQLKDEKKNNDGTIPYGYISKAVEHLNEKSPELKVTRHNLSYHIRKWEKQTTQLVRKQHHHCRLPPPKNNQAKEQDDQKAPQYKTSQTYKSV